MALSVRVRKIVGAALLLVFIPLYALITVTVATAQLPDKPVLVQTIFFAIFGLIWIVPAGAIIAWMQWPPKAAGGNAGD
jgi:hypothetical protein